MNKGGEEAGKQKELTKTGLGFPSKDKQKQTAVNKKTSEVKKNKKNRSPEF